MAALDHSRAGKIALLSDAATVIDKDTQVLELPPKVLRFIAKTLGAMAEGKTILLIPEDQELTTVQAAHLRTGPVPLNSIPRFISGFFAVVKPPLMLTAGF